MTEQKESPTGRTIADALVRHRVNGGAREDDSVELLDELVRTMAAKNLPAALSHLGFCRPRDAESRVSQLLVERAGPLPDIIWEHAFCSGVAKMLGTAIGRISLHGRPGNAHAYEIVIFNSAGTPSAWSGKPTPAATAFRRFEEAAHAHFKKMIDHVLLRGTPSDVLNVVIGRQQECLVPGMCVDRQVGRGSSKEAWS
ncbi:hypothetical protein [Burkholderia cepacia]|uniref:hypothetical protein n=1 Tax=Burkholderia cepacia TaxID=292 RepID=UPI002AB67EFA|nr:hypothetical protein [Burkholderia cepacia]